MSFGATPVDGSTTPIPMSSAVPDGTSTPLAVEGGPAKSTGGNNLAPVAVYSYDGYNVTMGTQADANTANTMMGRLTKIRDLLNATLPVSVTNATALGQATAANSNPVVPSSDHPLSQVASSDGLLQTKVIEEALWLYTSGGPVDTTGKPQQLSGDRLRSWQGKNPGTGTITATVSGDANLVFSVAPKTIMPGQGIVLSGGATPEVVYVSTSYVPSNTATSIPLQVTVVTAGQVTAKWDQFHPYGGNAGAGLTHFGVLPSIAMMQDAGSGANGLDAIQNASVDTIGVSQTLATNAVTFNGTTMDRQRGNLGVSLLASAARTTTQTSADIINYNHRGIKVTLDMTTVGTGSVTLTINYKDPASAKYILLLSGVAVVTNITSVYTIYPGLPATANVSANDVLPRIFQIVVTANNANSATYSVGYSLLV